MAGELRCANTSCKWRKAGKCLLFAGVTALQCLYRIDPKTKKPTTNKTNKRK